MLIDQQLANTNICFSHLSDKFISHFSIPISKFWRVVGRNGHKPTLFLLLYIYILKKSISICILFFQFSSHPRILISGILGKNEVRPPLFTYIFSSPNPNFGTFWEKLSWTQLVKYPFVFGHSIRQWDLTEVNLNTMQPFQMFRYVHSEAFCSMLSQKGK